MSTARTSATTLCTSTCGTLSPLPGTPSEPGATPRHEDVAAAPPTVTHAEAIEHRAAPQPPLARRSSVAGDAQPTPLNPATLVDFVRWGGIDYLGIRDKIAFAPLSRDLNEAARAHDSNPHHQAVFAAQDRQRAMLQRVRQSDQPPLTALWALSCAERELAGARPRAHAFHARVRHASYELQSTHAAVCSAIEEANATGVVPDQLSVLARAAHDAMVLCGKFVQAIPYAELAMAFETADDTWPGAAPGPRLSSYCEIAEHLASAGTPELGAALLQRVRPPQDGVDGEFERRLWAHSLGEMQVHMRDWRGALRTIGAEGIEIWAPDLAAIAFHHLAQQAGDPVEKASLLAHSEAALARHEANILDREFRLIGIAKVFFATGRPDDARACLHALRDMTTRPVMDLLNSAFVRCSASWPVIQTLPLPPHHDMREDMEHVPLPLPHELPQITVAPRHRILSVKDLQPGAPGSHRPRSESDAKR